MSETKTLLSGVRSFVTSESFIVWWYVLLISLFTVGALLSDIELMIVAGVWMVIYRIDLFEMRVK